LIINFIFNNKIYWVFFYPINKNNSHYCYNLYLNICFILVYKNTTYIWLLNLKYPLKINYKNQIDNVVENGARQWL